MTTETIARFYRLIESARPPQRADRSALGTLPTRAYRYCEAVRTASAFGWYVFAPLEIRLLWDGCDIFWHHKGAEDWLPLQPAAQAPGQSARFDAAAPARLHGCCPPLLTALPEPGTIQVWTGLMVRTAPGWSLLVRGPANLPGPGGYVHFEGVVEADRWFGPLFVNLRLTRTNTPIRLAADFPLLQAQPVPRPVLTDETLNATAFVAAANDFTPADWDDYERIIAGPSLDRNRPFGADAARRRKRAGDEACPFSAARAGGG
ncbi:MAG TPA: DUF6065 family protein [Acetobacteraceae bacterium]|nr:DUF6065 family protein [Acetobacteraceae bacterium]